MLTGIHFLLTYKCLFECDHCFVYSSPQSEGTFTLNQLRKILDEAIKIGTIKWIYFEGGEPFLYYPLLIEGIGLATRYGFKTGVVTNAYFATNTEDAKKWLMPLNEMKVDDLSISDDEFHSEGKEESPAKIALKAARELGMNVGSITIDEPISKKIENMRKKGDPVIGGEVMFKGRASEKLVKDLAKISWKEFTECPHEDLVNPERIHVDSYGNVHLCQGISMGNMWQTPLSELIRNYRFESHPVINPIVKGGPAELTEFYEVDHEKSYVDACHLCFETRKKLIAKFPEYLAPKQVYGL
jgi:MoaA/NifB/PqqE/SkfB family radical SAM enzyme